MGAQSSVRKQLAAGAAGLVAMVLAGASFAWACTSGIETLAPNPRTAPPGATVTVEGTFWDRGVVHIYLAPTGSTGNRVELTSVAVTNMREHKSFSTQVTVPALAPGFYRMGASLTHATGDQAGQTVESVVGTYLFRVLAQTPASNSNGTPAGTSSPGTPATGHPTAGTPTASNESAVNTANQPAPAADGSAPAVANTAPLPAPEAATPAPVSAATNAGGALLPTAPFTNEGWTSGQAQVQKSTPSLLDEEGSSGSNSALLVGAGFLGIGTVALFAGFTVAVARRRRAPAF
jgi:hypothetical protein